MDMEQIEPIETTEGALLAAKDALETLGPPIPEPRWDPEKAAMRKVRVLKVPYDQDPMKEKTVFEFAGFVYICYAKKTRGRSMIRCLGMAEIDAPKKQTPFEAGKLLDEATKELDEDESDVGDAGGDAIKEAIDYDAINKLVKDIQDTMEKEKEAEPDGQS